MVRKARSEILPELKKYLTREYRKLEDEADEEGRRFNQEIFAEICGVSQSQMSQFLQGVKPGTWESMMNIAIALQSTRILEICGEMPEGEEAQKAALLLVTRWHELSEDKIKAIVAIVFGDADTQASPNLGNALQRA